MGKSETYLAAELSNTPDLMQVSLPSHVKYSGNKSFWSTANKLAIVI